MKTVESVPCACGKGALSVEVMVFGIWRIEKALQACLVCGSEDVQAARDAASAQKSKTPTS